MKDKVTLADKEGLIAWASLASVLVDTDVKGIEERFAKLPGGKRDLALMRKLAEKYMQKLLWEAIPMSKDDARWFVQTLKLMRIYTGIQGRYGHESVDRMADFGVYLSYDDVNAILDALSDHCLLCSKSKKDAQDCPLRKALGRIPTQDTSEDNFCAVQRAYTEAVYST